LNGNVNKNYRLPFKVLYGGTKIENNITGSYLQKRAADKHPYELYLQLNEGRAYEDQGEEPTNELDL